MQVTLKDDQGIREANVLFVGGMVLRGNRWFPGVVIQDRSVVANCAAYAINDGSLLACDWESEDDRPEMSFVVSSVTSLELSQLSLLDAKLPNGATICTADGYQFSVIGGEITDGDMAFGSLGEMEVDFVLTNNSMRPVAPQQGGLSM